VGRKPLYPDIPKAQEIKRQCQAIGYAFWREYYRYRDSLKEKNLTPREAVARAYREKQVAARYAALQERMAAEGKEIGPGPLDPKPGVVTGIDLPKAELKEVEVGNEEQTIPEQIRWVQENVALWRLKGKEPERFPSPGALFWWQQAIGRNDRFEDKVAKFLAPHSERDEELMRDGEYQLREVEAQLAAARDEALRDSAQDADLELAVPP
jgi:hypothetical protein